MARQTTPQTNLNTSCKHTIMSQYNHGPIVETLIHKLDNEFQTPSPPKRESEPHDPCLLARLPSTGTLLCFISMVKPQSLSKAFIQRDVEEYLSRAALRQLRRSPTPPIPQDDIDIEETAEQEDTAERERRPSNASVTSSSSIRSLKQLLKQKDTSKTYVSWKEPQVGDPFISCAVGVSHVLCVSSHSKS